MLARQFIIKISILLVVLISIPARLLAAETFRVASYNVENYVIDHGTARPFKSEAARAKVWESILAARPDVLALEEIGGTNALIEIQSALQERGLKLPFWEYVEGFDTNIHVALLSRFPLDERQPHTNDSYLLNGERLFVSRGFLQVDVEVSTNYSFTLIAAHLKSKRKVGFADESDMRLEEATLLKKHIDDCFAQDKNVNLLVLGDMNDLRDSKPVRMLIGRGNHALIDTRPCELVDGKPSKGRAVCWTQFYEKEDLFSRMDYILVSHGMSREWIAGESFIPVVPDWGLGSDHRPVVATFYAEDK